MSLLRTVIVVPAIALLLAGCVPGDASTTPSPTVPSDASGPAVTPGATPTATTTPVPDAIALDIACGDLISAQVMYDFNPNYSLLADHSPGEGSLAARALEAKGVACRWINQTSGETIDVSAAHLNDPTLAETVAGAQSFAATSDFDGDGYFGDGSAQAFSGPIWVTVTSAAFTAAADAAPLVNAALSSAAG